MATIHPLGKKLRVGGGKLKAILRKHSQLATFFGAFIVFATFMVREEIRESLKDLVNSVETAQTVFASRRDTSTIAEQLNTVGTITSDMAFLVIKGRTRTERRGGAILALRFRVFAIKDYAGSLGASLDNISRLLEKLDADANQTMQVGALRARVVDLQTKCDEAASHIEPWAEDSKSTDADKKDQYDAQFAWLTPLISDSWGLSPEIQKFADEVLKRAEEEKQKREHQYRLVNGLSIGLFTLGWGLGLAAKLYGVNNVAEEA